MAPPSSIQGSSLSKAIRVAFVALQVHRRATADHRLYFGSIGIRKHASTHDPCICEMGCAHMISAKLVASLLVAAAEYTGYAVPGAPPRILSLPHAELAERVCGKPCGVMGFTTPEGEILIDESLKIGRDPAATSVLVHELTHFLQISVARREGSLSCQAWIEREREAYDVQFRWLRAQAPSMRILSAELARLGQAPILPSCRPEGEAANGDVVGLNGR